MYHIYLLVLNSLLLLDMVTSLFPTSWIIFCFYGSTKFSYYPITLLIDTVNRACLARPVNDYHINRLHHWSPLIPPARDRTQITLPLCALQTSPVAVSSRSIHPPSVPPLPISPPNLPAALVARWRVHCVSLFSRDKFMGGHWTKLSQKTIHVGL